jgi:hypothetical protein
MSRITDKKYCRLDFENPSGSIVADKAVNTQESNKFSIRYPSNPGFGSIPFAQLIHMTVTLKIIQRSS